MCCACADLASGHAWSKPRDSFAGAPLPRTFAAEPLLLLRRSMLCEATELAAFVSMCLEAFAGAATYIDIS